MLREQKLLAQSSDTWGQSLKKPKGGNVLFPTRFQQAEKPVSKFEDQKQGDKTYWDPIVPAD